MGTVLNFDGLVTVVAVDEGDVELVGFGKAVGGLVSAAETF